ADRVVELAQPGALPVPGGPDDHRVAQVVQLDPAVVVAGPHVRQRPAELGVPHQRRQVVQHDGHADVVDRAVGRPLDGAVGDRAPAEQPYVAGPGEIDGLVQTDAHFGHGCSLGAMRWWKAIGLAGLAGVAATGVIVVRAERRRRAYTPDEVRDRLRSRFAEAVERAPERPEADRPGKRAAD